MMETATDRKKQALRRFASAVLWIGKSEVLSVRFKNLGFSQVGILSWGNLRTPNSYIDFSVLGSGLQYDSAFH